MNRKEILAMQDEYIIGMIKSMPVLRAATRMTQAILAEKIGVSRQTIVLIETGKRPMPWSLYLAITFVFEQYGESKKLLDSFELFDAQFIKAI